MGAKRYFIPDDLVTDAHAANIILVGANILGAYVASRQIYAQNFARVTIMRHICVPPFLTLPTRLSGGLNSVPGYEFKRSAWAAFRARAAVDTLDGFIRINIQRDHIPGAGIHAESAANACVGIDFFNTTIDIYSAYGAALHAGSRLTLTAGVRMVIPAGIKIRVQAKPVSVGHQVAGYFYS
jgi:hypothetical protein